MRTDQNWSEIRARDYVCKRNFAYFWNEESFWTKVMRSVVNLSLVVLLLIHGSQATVDSVGIYRTFKFLFHFSDDCFVSATKTATHDRVVGYETFCMGVKSKEINYGMKRGCLATYDCGYFLSTKIIEVIKGSSYLISHLMFNRTSFPK